MPRTARASVGQYCYHVINRGNGRDQVFHADGDFQAFIALLGDACRRLPMRVLAYCLMPNHFHLGTRKRCQEPFSPLQLVCTVPAAEPLYNAVTLIRSLVELRSGHAQHGRRASLPRWCSSSARCASAACSSENVRAMWTSNGPASISRLSLSMISRSGSPS